MGQQGRCLAMVTLPGGAGMGPGSGWREERRQGDRSLARRPSPCLRAGQVPRVSLLRAAPVSCMPAWGCPRSCCQQGGHREGWLVALAQWLGKCRLGCGLSMGWEPLARQCLSFPPCSRAAREAARAVSRQVSPACSDMGWLMPVVVSLADAEQSSSPRTGIGSDQEDSKPITLGEEGEQGSGKQVKGHLALSPGSLQRRWHTRQAVMRPAPTAPTGCSGAHQPQPATAWHLQ